MSKRKGGLTQPQLDPDVAAFQRTAARNVAALSKKQRYDDTRVRLRLDVPPWLKDTLAAAAKEEGTSMNQLGSYLLAGGLALLLTTDHIQEALRAAKTTSTALRINFDVKIPDDIKQAIDGTKPD